MTPEFPSKPRRRPTRVKLGAAPRDSNLIRASVLETALELGFGQNSTVADWIFNNPLSEEAEEPLPGQDDHVRLDSKADPVLEAPEATTLTFTSGSNSISDESSSLNSPNIAPSAAVAVFQVHTHKPSITEPPQVHFGDFSTDQLQLFSPFTLPPHGVPRGKPGNNSSKLPKEDERSRSQDDSLPRNHSHENPSPRSADVGYISEGQYLSKGKSGKGKDNPGKSKRNKGSKSKDLDDGKASEKDGDYASDGGYLSASSNKSQSKSPGRVKSRAMAFFRRRPKKSASDDEDEASIPPVPALPAIPRPSSPKILERRPTPSSPTRSSFSPLTLNLTSPPASPPRRRVSKSPPPLHVRATSPKRLDHVSAPQRPVSPLVTSTSAPTLLTPAPTAASPLPSSMPGTPLSTTSFPSTSTPSTSLGGGAGSTRKSLSASSARQHLSIPPPAPPPTLPLPQLPPSPSIGPNEGSALLATPTTQSRRRVSIRPVPVSGPMQPLIPHRTASPLRPLLSPRRLSVAHDQLDGKEFISRQRSVTAFSAGFGSTPAFLQRKIQHGPPLSPRRPPPDAPLPPSPSPAPSTRPCTPVAPSKFHEHFSSVSSVPPSQALSTPTSMSPSLSTSTLSESSSGPSMRSSYVSSVSGRSEEPVRELNVPEHSRPPTSASTISGSSYSQPIASTLSRPAIGIRSHVSGWSDVSSSIYPSTMHRESSSVTTYDAEDADVEDAAPKSGVDQEDDDASVYPSEDKTAGRRTMYLFENGGLDENGDEIVIAGSRYWDGHEVPPPLPPLPPMPTRPGPGYF